MRSVEGGLYNLRTLLRNWDLIVWRRLIQSQWWKRHLGFQLRIRINWQKLKPLMM
jgi:hypothetical protein